MRAIIEPVVYESFEQPLISRHAFAWRIARHAILALVLLGGSLLVGIAGYMGFAHLKVADAFLNAATSAAWAL